MAAAASDGGGGGRARGASVSAAVGAAARSASGGGGGGASSTHHRASLQCTRARVTWNHMCVSRAAPAAGKGAHTRGGARALCTRARCRAESRLRAHADGARESVICLWRRGRWRVKLTTRVRVRGSYVGRRRSAAAMHMRACCWSAVSLVVVFCRLSRRSRRRRRRLIADDRRRVAGTTAVTSFISPISMGRCWAALDRGPCFFARAREYAALGLAHPHTPPGSLGRGAIAVTQKKPPFPPGKLPRLLRIRPRHAPKHYGRHGRSFILFSASRAAARSRCAPIPSAKSENSTMMVN